MKNILWFLVVSLFIIQACSIKTEESVDEAQVRRYGWVIKVKPEKLEEYKALHADPWPGVDNKLKESNIRNYSIYYRDGFLFSYLEYTGSDFEKDMQKMAEDSLTQAWWKLTDPCQIPVESAGEGVWWADMEEVYHLD